MQKQMNITGVQVLITAVSFIAAVVLTYTASSIVQTLFTLSALVSAGASISADLWLRTIGQDFYGHTFSGFIPLGGLVCIGFLLALPTAAVIAKYTGWPRYGLYPLAGAAAMATLHYGASHMIYDLNLMVGTRSVWGLSCFVLSGALGGAVFIHCLSRLSRLAKKDEFSL